MTDQIKRFLDGKLILNCKTEADANELMKICDANGVGWGDGKSMWNEYNADTCYSLASGYLGYSRIDFYIETYEYLAIEVFEAKPKREVLTFEEVTVKIQKGETYECTDENFHIKEVSKDKMGNIRLVHISQLENELYINHKARFVKKEERKAVTFQEALASGKKVRVEHEKYNDEFKECCDSDEDCLCTISRLYNEGKYLHMTDIMLFLGWYINTDDAREVIENGKWYIEQ